MSGYRGLSFQADYELVLYFIGIHLVAKSIAKDADEAQRLGVGTNFDTFATVAKLEILNELKYLQSKNNMT